jgi:hypothetical protein
MLAHAEIVVRAPYRHLAVEPVVVGAGKATAAPFEIGEDAIAALGVKFVDPLFE